MSQEEFKIGDTSISYPLNISEKIYDELKKIIGNGEITRGNIIAILLSLMQLIESYDKLSGKQKKAIILSNLYRFIDDKIENDQEKMELKLLVQVTLPSVIDTIISFDKKELVINIQKKCSKFFLCFQKIVLINK